MRGTSSFLGCFSWKNRTTVEILRINEKRNKGEILNKNWAKNPCNAGKMFTTCNIFYATYIIFILLLLSKIRTKVKIYDGIWAKTPYNTVTIFTKCNVFMGVTWAKRRFYSYIENEPKGEILDRNWVKTRYNTATIFTKCNVFLSEAYPLFLVFREKK